MMELELEIRRFKMDLLRKMPFYGDIVMRLPFTENRRIATAQTNGRKIEYNPKFLSDMTQGQRNFILMHEVFHVLLFHCKRNAQRDPRLWNTAADMIVNGMLQQLMPHMRSASIPFERPAEGIFAEICAGDTVETLYETLLADNRSMGKNAGKVMVRQRRRWGKTDPVEMRVPDDIVFADPDAEGTSATPAGISAGGGTFADENELSELMVLQIIRESALANRSDAGSYFVPEQVFRLAESKHIRWQTLLREFFTESMSDESSYATPERKYIHMDIILPGYGTDDGKLEEVWAFVDSSGSVGKNEMEQFLTQLYRIAEEFKCMFHICYWDTQVTDVYRNITNEKDVLKSLPHHSGGTNINCVYRWLKNNKVTPDVMLILTDGYFGSLDGKLFVPSLGKKTILVLSGSIPVNDDMKRIGKITRLE